MGPIRVDPLGRTLVRIDSLLSCLSSGMIFVCSPGSVNYVVPFMWLIILFQQAQKILKKAEKTHKQRVEVTIIEDSMM